MDWKELLKPNRSKIALSILLLLTTTLFFMAYFIGIAMPYGLTILQILGMPFALILSWASTYLLLGGLSVLGIILALNILWLYLISCILTSLKDMIFPIKWSTRKLGALASLIVFGFIAYGFLNLGFGDIFIATADDSRATAEDVAEVVKGNNQFALDIYSEISKDSEENLFFSPWGISNALAMTYEGARGQTADEMEAVLNFPEDDNVRRPSFAWMLNRINKAGGKYELHTANAIWLQEDYPFLEDFKDIIKRYYLGEVENLDFVGNPTGSSRQINNWVSRHTNNKIKKIVSPSNFNELTRAVLTNAIYFKGEWKHKFDEKDTSPEDFTLDSGEEIEVPMMKLEDDDLDFNYTENEEAQVLEMIYKGDKISMLIILPKEDIHALESELTEEKIQEWKSDLEPETIYIYIPKYTFETSYSLKDYLKGMGMEIPFEWPGVDFSGMDGTKMLFIDDVLHKAYVDVNEEGTEAAAATAVMMFTTGIPEYVEFRADHPFIFIIQERNTGNILFMGRVMRPEGY